MIEPSRHGVTDTGLRPSCLTERANEKASTELVVRILESASMGFRRAGPMQI